MADGDLVTRVWRGPFVGERHDGTRLEPGDEVEVTAAEAESSWYEDPAAPAPDPPLEPEPEPLPPGDEPPPPPPPPPADEEPA